jgi:hypothetical protein
MPNRIPRIGFEGGDPQLARLANVEQIKAGIDELRAGKGKTLERNYKPARKPALLSSGALKDLEEMTKAQRLLAVEVIEMLEANPVKCGPCQMFRFAHASDKVLVVFCEEHDGIPHVYQIVVAYRK